MLDDGQNDKPPMTKTLLIGSDHAGFALKQAVKRHAEARGWRVEDLTPTLIPGDDYPLVAKAAARKVARGAAANAVLVCGTGLGMDIAANRVNGARAVVIREPKEAALAREHNHANILILGGWITPAAKAKKIFDAWAAATPSKAARHVRRVKQLDA